MLNKRFIGVITVKDGWAVQSFGYRRYLPLGSPECLAENLDRWGVDEILVLCIDRSSRGLGPDLKLLQRLGKLGLSTPLSYGGGIYTVDHAAAVIQTGADRLCLDSVLRGDNQQLINNMAALLGSQALIAALPLSTVEQQVHWYDYQSKKLTPPDNSLGSLFVEGIISEALVIDYLHEGQPDGFDINLIRYFPYDAVQLIAFGGLSRPEQLASLLTLSQVVAVGVGNFLNYSEHAVQSLKQQLSELPLRPPIYASSY